MGFLDSYLASLQFLFKTAALKVKSDSTTSAQNSRGFPSQSKSRNLSGIQSPRSGPLLLLDLIDFLSS